MDKSPTYISMCKDWGHFNNKAGTHEWQYRDYVADKDGTVRQLGVDVVLVSQMHVWLPTEDQIKPMIPDELIKNNILRALTVASPEQMWMSLMMKEMCCATWNGKEWVKDKDEAAKQPPKLTL